LALYTQGSTRVSPSIAVTWGPRDQLIGSGETGVWEATTMYITDPYTVLHLTTSHSDSPCTTSHSDSPCTTRVIVTHLVLLEL